MAEEHQCHRSPPDVPRLCANRCGFFGSPATLGLCSKCYRELRLREELFQQQQHQPPYPTKISSPVDDKEEDTEEEKEKTLVLPSFSSREEGDSKDAPSAGPIEREKPKRRCGACGRRLGLTGFRCRCGGTYCGAHRHPEGHACGYDYKGSGREAIARDNPIIKASKLENRI